jgi:hypothetical protein
MKARHIVMLAALAITAWLASFGDKTPSGGVAEPVKRPASSKSASAPHSVATATNVDNVSGSGSAAESGASSKQKHKPEVEILALRDRTELIGGASSGNGGNLFTSQSWAPPPPPVKAGPPPPPTAPAMPFTFLGKKHEDATWEVYLAHSETTLIVREGSMIEGTYRVESIKPPLLTVIYLPMNQRQTLPIGDAE